MSSGVGRSRKFPNCRKVSEFFLCINAISPKIANFAENSFLWLAKREQELQIREDEIRRIIGGNRE